MHFSTIRANMCKKLRVLRKLSCLNLAFCLVLGTVPNLRTSRIILQCKPKVLGSLSTSWCVVEELGCKHKSNNI